MISVTSTHKALAILPIVEGLTPFPTIALLSVGLGIFAFFDRSLESIQALAIASSSFFRFAFTIFTSIKHVQIVPKMFRFLYYSTKFVPCQGLTPLFFKKLFLFCSDYDMLNNNGGVNMATIGERIKLARKQAGFTQEKLAKKIGVSMMSLRRYENDSRIVTKPILEKIANALEISTSELMGYEKGSIPHYLETGDKSVAWRRQMNLAFNRLNETGQEEAAKRVQELTEIPRYQEDKNA